MSRRQVWESLLGTQVAMPEAREGCRRRSEVRADSSETPTTEVRAGEPGNERSMEAKGVALPKGKIPSAKRNHEDQKLLKGVESKGMYFRV